MSAQRETAGDYRRYACLGYGAIAVVFGGFGVWAAMAPLDSAAIAQARVAVETDRKPVQHLEGGIVQEILVKEAQHVEEGQVLFRLQPTQALANADLQRKQLDTALAIEARLVAEQDGASRITFPEAVVQRQALPETANAIADQKRQFAERARSLRNQIAILNARIEQSTREIEGRDSKKAALASQLASYATELERVSSLAAKGLYPQNRLLSLERERTRVAGELGTTDSEIARLREAIEEARHQIRQTQQHQLEEVAQQLAEVRGRISDVREKLTIAQDVLTRMEVRAPRRGIVQALKVHAVGAVVRPGDMLAEVVPEGDVLILAARVSPLDIQSVSGGLRAEVRFPAFSSLHPPTIFGQIESISAASVVDETTKEPYYLARVIIDLGTIAPQLSKRLVPGMPADVLISTGERTMLQYLLGPLRDALAKTMRER
jgi:HlyD family secretion protein